ncbi:MAG TPA: PAS domain-containing protein [Pseudogulbenkiania sp.]|nr:PAS domain-containing protein [Pseudogulbenkiania sp.]
MAKTDLHGKILYANPEFMRISGFAEEELLGQDLNIVRHPDMPVQAFADLWVAFLRGQTWKGLVKNRRKDSGFYWVKAHVAPLHELGQHVGYMSVRIAPSEVEKQQAEQLYRAVRRGTETFPATSPLHARSVSFWMSVVLLAIMLNLATTTLVGVLLY